MAPTPTPKAEALRREAWGRRQREQMEVRKRASAALRHERAEATRLHQLEQTDRPPPPPRRPSPVTKQAAVGGGSGRPPDYPALAVPAVDGCEERGARSPAGGDSAWADWLDRLPALHQLLMEQAVATAERRAECEWSRRLARLLQTLHTELPPAALGWDGAESRADATASCAQRHATPPPARLGLGGSVGAVAGYARALLGPFAAALCNLTSAVRAASASALPPLEWSLCPVADAQADGSRAQLLLHFASDAAAADAALTAAAADSAALNAEWAAANRPRGFGQRPKCGPDAAPEGGQPDRAAPLQALTGGGGAEDAERKRMLALLAANSPFKSKAAGGGGGVVVGGGDAAAAVAGAARRLAILELEAAPFDAEAQ
eukprot:SAG11_NODE_4336_length_1943_cov_3.791215_1_plen_376_part_01